MRIKRGVAHVKRRKNLLKKTKGFKWGQKNLIKRATEAAIHSGVNAYRGRKTKKRDARATWNISISAATRAEGMSYSAFMGAMKKKNITLNRKVMSEIAQKYPDAFKALIQSVKK